MRDCSLENKQAVHLVIIFSCIFVTNVFFSFHLCVPRVFSFVLLPSNVFSTEGRPDGTMCICIPVYISRCMWILLLTTQVLGRVDGKQGRKRVALIFFLIFFFFYFSDKCSIRFFQTVPTSLPWALATCLIQHLLFKLNFRRTPCVSLSGLFNFFLMWKKLFFNHWTGFCFAFFFFLAFITNSHWAYFIRLTYITLFFADEFNVDSHFVPHYKLFV